MLDADSTIARLALALAIGLLVGLERGWRQRADPEGSRTAGIRTFGAAGLLGGVSAALSQTLGGSAVLVAGLVVFAAILAWFSSREGRHDHNFSVTGVIAGILVFVLGALAVLGDVRVAAAGGAAVAGLLASRDWLHGLLQRLSWPEVRSAILLALMTAVVLPILPDRALDPWGGFNPHEIWLFTVLIAGISFLGYVAVRVFGTSRGLLVSGLAGAVVSSTAVTVAFARKAKGEHAARPLAGGACLAAMISVLRVTSVVTLLAPAVLPEMAPAALGSALVFAAAGTVLLFGSRADYGAADAARNPFDVGALLLFALAFALVSLASAFVVSMFGSASLTATSALSGAFDVDVAVLSALRLASDGVGAETAGLAVLAALAANAAGRLALAVAAGPPRFWLPYLFATATAALAGIAIYLALPGTAGG